MIPKHLKKTYEWRRSDILFCIAYDHQQAQAWAGSSDFGIYRFDFNKPEDSNSALVGTEHQSYVTDMVHVGGALVTSSYDRHLVWWDIESGKPIRRLAAHDRWIRKVIASPDHARLYTVADDMQVKAWDAQSGELIASFTDHAELTPHHYPSMLYAIAASPDGQWIATGDRIGHVAVWDASTFEKVSELETPVMYTWDPRARRHSIGGIRSLAFSPDSSRLAVGGIGKIGNIDHLGGPARLEVFDWVTGDRQLELEDSKMKGLIEQIVWAPDQTWILSVGGDHGGFLTVYDADTGGLLHQDKQTGHIHAISHDPEFQSIYVASHQSLTQWTMQQEADA